MNKDLTELVYILDSSGSMYELEADTIGGFNSLIEEQKKETGSAYVTTVLFNNEIAVLHDRMVLSDVPKMTTKDYVAKGSTALLDAVGETIVHIKDIHKYAREEELLHIWASAADQNGSSLNTGFFFFALAR